MLAAWHFFLVVVKLVVIVSSNFCSKLGWRLQIQNIFRDLRQKGFLQRKKKRSSALPCRRRNQLSNQIGSAERSCLRLESYQCHSKFDFPATNNVLRAACETNSKANVCRRNPAVLTYSTVCHCLLVEVAPEPNTTKQSKTNRGRRSPEFFFSHLRTS